MTATTSVQGASVTTGPLVVLGGGDSQSGGAVGLGQADVDQADGHAGDVSEPVVVAVLVVHDGEPWLPRVLPAVLGQSRPADVVVAVDTGSRDGSVELLREWLGADHVVQASRELGFGGAVRRGLAHIAGLTAGAATGSATGTATGVDGRHGWVWTLHDDAEPHTHVLRAELDEAARSASVGVVGPKLVRWDDPDVLTEVGLTVSRAGRRSTGVDGGERDQGQHDHRRDVLAVSSAGMLVRRDVWDALGGFDPALPLLRDDIDLCWRAHLSGHRVVLAPGAVVADAQASTRGLRRVDAVSGDIRRVDRQHGMHVALARASVLSLPVLVVWLVLSSAVTSLVLIAAKSPRRAVTELLALGGVLGRPWRWWGSRWRSRAQRRVPRSSIGSLLPARADPVRRALSMVGGWAVGSQPTVLPGPAPGVGVSGALAEPGPVADEAQDHVVASARWPVRLVRHPLTWVLIMLCLTAVWSWRAVLVRIWGPGSLSGGELRSVSASSEQRWHATFDGVRGAGLGTSQPGSVAGALHAVWVRGWEAVAGAQAPTVALAVPLLVAPVLAGASAYVAAGVATRSRLLRAWAALVYGGTPLLAAAAADGRIGPVVGAVLAPVVTVLVARAVSRGGDGQLTATGAAVLGIAAIACVLPVLAIPALLVGLGALVVGQGAVRVRGGLLVVGPLAVLGPWWRAIVDQPQLVLAGSGAVVDASASSRVVLPWIGSGAQPVVHVPGGWHDVLPLSGWQLAVALAGTVLVAAPAAAALLRRGARGQVVLGLWVLGTGGLAMAALAPSVDLAAGTGSRLTPWPGTGFVITTLMFVAAVVVAADNLRRRLSRHGFGWRQLALAPVVLAAVVGPVAATGSWAWRGSVVPVQHTAARGLPLVAQDAATGPTGSRTLVLEQVAGQLRYAVDGAEPGPLARDLPPLPDRSVARREADDALRGVVAQLAASDPTATGSAVLDGLGEFAVSFVLLRSPVSQDVAERLDRIGGLTRIGRSADGQLWRVGEGPMSASRVRLITPRGADPGDAGRAVAVAVAGPHAAVDTVIPAGPQGRLLVLAEVASPRWRASLDGRPLAAGRVSAVRPGGGWRQAFEVPAAGGRLVVDSGQGTSSRWWWATMVITGVIALLALPLRRPRGRLR
ncbi:MAG: glycosyltransferase [Angustibacter sp.]